MTTETKIVKGKHTLSEAEIVGVAPDLATSMKEKETLETVLKDKSAEIKKMISAEEENIKDLLEKIRTGEEDRDYKCKVERDYEKKEKKFICTESGRVIKTVPFNASDYQHEIGAESTSVEDETEEENN